MKKLSHTDNKGKANMVDVGQKPVQTRTAVATGFISLSKETLKLVKENGMKKGDVLTIAEIAGIQAAKKTRLWYRRNRVGKWLGYQETGHYANDSSFENIANEYCLC